MNFLSVQLFPTEEQLFSSLLEDDLYFTEEDEFVRCIATSPASSLSPQNTEVQSRALVSAPYPGQREEVGSELGEIVLSLSSPCLGLVVEGANPEQKLVLLTVPCFSAPTPPTYPRLRLARNSAALPPSRTTRDRPTPWG